MNSSKKLERQIDNVLIADDHELVMAGIYRILASEFTVGDVVMLNNPKNVLAMIENRLFDLYILDIELGEISGFDIIETILKKQPGAKIIVCTMHEEIWYINRLLGCGARGILLKRSSVEHLGDAILCVMENGEYMCPRFQKFRKELAGKDVTRKKNYDLTPRENIVLKYIVSGLKSKEIASLIFVTEDAVEAHRKNLFLKLGVKNVAQLVAMAIRLNLVD